MTPKPLRKREASAFCDGMGCDGHCEKAVIKRDQEWLNAVEWLKREIWNECMKDHNIQLCGCQVCKQRLLIESLIDTAFAEVKE